MSTLPVPSDQDLCERLMQINRMAVESVDWKRSMDEILLLLRPALIFDNLAVYEAKGQPATAEVMYARAMGRGKSLEADIAWGETLAGKVIQLCTHMVEAPAEEDTERTRQPHLLGMPLMRGKTCTGALVLVRFGGPVFTRKDERLAGFLVMQIVIMLQHKALEHQVEILDVLRRQAYLQDSFVSMITHELRHPMGFIKGYVTTLLRDEVEWDSKTQIEFLQIIDHETDQLLELIDNMLDSARLQSGHLTLDFQPVRLDALLEGVITQARTHFSQLVIHLDCPAGLPSISGDPRRLGQVFNNLITNAHKYATGSEIWVTIKFNETRVEVSVKDLGPGIPAEYLAHIFERFFRNPDQSPSIHGSGLGLYICKQLVEAHGGEIQADSPPGAGLTVTVFLPHLSSPQTMDEAQQ